MAKKKKVSKKSLKKSTAKVPKKKGGTKRRRASKASEVRETVRKPSVLEEEPLRSEEGEEDEAREGAVQGVRPLDRRIVPDYFRKDEDALDLDEDEARYEDEDPPYAGPFDDEDEDLEDEEDDGFYEEGEDEEDMDLDLDDDGFDHEDFGEEDDEGKGK